MAACNHAAFEPLSAGAQAVGNLRLCGRLPQSFGAVAVRDMMVSIPGHAVAMPAVLAGLATARAS